MTGDGANHRARLCGLPAVLETLSERHRAGLEAGRAPVAHLVRAAVAHVDAQVANPASLQRSLAGDLVHTTVRPALIRYRDFLVREVLPRSRGPQHAGLCWLPDGEAFYRTAIRRYTTTDRDAEAVHRAGLTAVAALADEYREIGSRVFGTADLTEIFARLRGDPALRWESGADLRAVAEQVVRRAEAVAPKWFRTLPGQACAVEEQPSAVSPTTPPYYLKGSADGARPGTYFVNSQRLSEKLRSRIEASAFHEAVPGHHLEIASGQSRGELPLLRTTAGLSAFAEGWAVYAERLADEMGLYSGDVARLGMLEMESRRAGRLVADTGLHARGWSRGDAVRYLRRHTPMTLGEVESETDRYLSVPGQGLAYLTGKLEIQRLRTKAETALGPHFDVRDFHEALLRNGRLPLTTLAREIEGWLASV
ncbi:DUF885 domain-containing protein [Amycolatopsis jiangsuensis]|uniref:DUF885 domain-containing protein n=1 Tax=Amycolatopsis jiangsuensis TaxID=1181879 RepID=UPI0028B13DE4|nr:DUF885 domain-containing protein [Amycolatopsis jiangsuensis]